MATVVNDAAKRIDDYINSTLDFARPICKKLRSIIHKADPSIIEDWKWGPNFNKNGMVCGFGAFQKHVTFHFFQGARMKDPKRLFIKEDTPAKNTRRMQITRLDDIQEPTLVSYVKEAVILNTAEVSTPDRTITIPPDLKKLLDKNKAVQKFFESLSYTHRKEYVRWIDGAKKIETRKARLKKAVQMLTTKMKNP